LFLHLCHHLWPLLGPGTLPTKGLEVEGRRIGWVEPRPFHGWIGTVALQPSGAAICRRSIHGADLEMTGLATSDFADLVILRDAHAHLKRFAVRADKSTELSIARESRAAVWVAMLEDDIAAAMAGVRCVDRSLLVLLDLDHDPIICRRNR